VFHPHIACGRIFYLVLFALFGFCCEVSYPTMYVSVVIMPRIIKRKPKRKSTIAMMTGVRKAIRKRATPMPIYLSFLSSRNATL